MGKRIKKPAVRPEVYRQWLRRFEEDGESPPQIAKADGYDVRTVRKQIEFALNEREMREARAMVLRNALEEHYKDLWGFAQKLDTDLSSWPPERISPILTDDPRWQALREHLPRSPIWKAIQRWPQFVDQYETCVKETEQRVVDVSKVPKLNVAQAPGEHGFSEDGLIKSILFHVVSLARGHKGLKEVADFSLKRATDTGLHEAGMGAFFLGFLRSDKMTELQTSYLGLLDDAVEWEESDQLRQVITELQHQLAVLHDELITITLRRVVSGRCKYCPF